MEAKEMTDSNRRVTSEKRADVRVDLPTWSVDSGSQILEMK